MYIEYIISLVKSLYVCLRLLPIKQAFQLPILVRYNVKCSNLSGNIKLNCPPQCIRAGMIKVGFGDVGIIDSKYQRTILQISGQVCFEGSAFFGHACRISVGKNGCLKIGDMFRNSAGMALICDKDVVIGKNVLVSWDTTITDTDYHSVVDTSKHIVYPDKKEIRIGDRVWLGMGATVLKGVTIPAGTIVAAKAVVTKSVCTENCMVAGNPAMIKKYNVNRKL